MSGMKKRGLMAEYTITLEVRVEGRDVPWVDMAEKVRSSVERIASRDWEVVQASVDAAEEEDS